MENYTYIKLRERPELEQAAAAWFHGKWGVPVRAYLDCMDTAGIFAWTGTGLSAAWV